MSLLLSSNVRGSTQLHYIHHGVSFMSEISEGVKLSTHYHSDWWQIWMSAFSHVTIPCTLTKTSV